MRGVSGSGLGTRPGRGRVLLFAVTFGQDEHHRIQILAQRCLSKVTTTLMKKLNGSSLVALLWLVVGGSLACAAESRDSAPQGYYRFPAIHGDVIVFTAEGALWRVGISGCVAQPLTGDSGEESRSAFSPDGNMLAFLSQYEGPPVGFTMPVEGGLPTCRQFG